MNLLRVKKGYPIELSNCIQNRRFSTKYVSRPILLGGEPIRLTKQIVPTANLGLNSVGCCLQRWLKIEVVSLEKLVYNQTGVCTPAKPFPGRAIGRRHICGVRFCKLAGCIVVDYSKNDQIKVNQEEYL